MRLQPSIRASRTQVGILIGTHKVNDVFLLYAIEFVGTMATAQYFALL